MPNTKPNLPKTATTAPGLYGHRAEISYMARTAIGRAALSSWLRESHERAVAARNEASS